MSSNENQSTDENKSKFTWKIKNFATAINSENKHLKSERFELSNGKLFFYLNLCNGVTYPGPEWPQEHIFIYLWMTDPVKTFLKCKISFLDANGVKLNTQNGRISFDPTNPAKSVFNWQYSISRDYLLDPKNNILVNGSVSIHCEVELIDSFDSPNTNQILAATSKTLSQDLLAFHQTGKLTDVALVIGEQKLPAHKMMLAARSKVFAAMFEHDCEEKQQNIIKIIDFDADVMKQLLRYIYTEQVESLDKYASDLLAASNKYQIDSLKSSCEQYLVSNISHENAANALLLADLHNSNKLKDACVDYITDNVSKVKDSEGWKLLCKNPELLTELLLRIAEKTNR